MRKAKKNDWMDTAIKTIINVTSKLTSELSDWTSIIHAIMLTPVAKTAKIPRKIKNPLHPERREIFIGSSICPVV
jgi:hypothetical protein